MSNMALKPLQGNASRVPAALTAAGDPHGWLTEKMSAARLLREGDLQTEVVVIGPQLAAAILERCNIDNRAVKAFRVKLYALAMKEGRWKLTAQGISLSRDYFLNNGQHRLMAIIEANVAVPMNITFGEDRGVFDILDTGANRSASDTLAIAGYKATANLAASARVLMMIEGGTPSANASYSNDVIKNWVAKHKELEDYTAFGTTIGKKLKTSAAGITAALYLIGETSKYSEVGMVLPEFVRLLRDGAGLTKKGPILTLREGLVLDQFIAKVHAGIAGPVICAAVIKAWNLWLLDRKGSLPALTWAAGEAFPAPR